MCLTIRQDPRIRHVYKSRLNQKSEVGQHAKLMIDDWGKKEAKMDVSQKIFRNQQRETPGRVTSEQAGSLDLPPSHTAIRPFTMRTGS